MAEHAPKPPEWCPPAGDKPRLRIGVFVLVVAITACAPSAPRQPFGVPRTAAWANGHWVDCFRDEKDEHVFACTIYTKDAKLDAKGTFLLVDDVAAQKRSAAPREPMKFTSWDGAAVHLEGGRALARR